jgi:protein SDA1
MNLISRLMGIHELILLPFYSYLQRYLQPHQNEVVHLLTFAAQAVHEVVPPDVSNQLVAFINSVFRIIHFLFALKVGEALLKTISNNFITERNSFEVMAVG